MKDIFIKMYRGWLIHQASYDPVKETYNLTLQEGLEEACGGNELEARALNLFSYWENDIQDISPYFGVALETNESGDLYVKEDVPPPPTPDHWWNKGEWHAPAILEMADVAAPVVGGP
jgi:hypothetical protein